jgi:hypothetical protein
MDKRINLVYEKETVLKNIEKCHCITGIKSGEFDYTNWHKEYFDGMELDEISREAVTYAEKHPHEGRGRRI